MASVRTSGEVTNMTTGSVLELTQRNVKTVAGLEAAAQAHRTVSDQLADAIAGFCGKILFVWVNLALFALWITLNTVPLIRHFDPFPFQFLALCTGLEAIFLTTFVLVSQNRQARLAERRNHLDLQINLLSEQEASKMLAMMRAMMTHMGLADDPEANAMAETTKPEQLVTQIQQTIEQDASKANEDQVN